jgi:hypothetical protein
MVMLRHGPAPTPRPGQVVGRIAALWRYPVKSMGAEALDAADLGWHGLVGDRRWAVVRDDKVTTGFPWLTLRERFDLNRFRPAYTQPGDANRSSVVVRVDDASEVELLDPRFLAGLGEGLSVMKLYRGTFDVMPLSLLTAQTLASLGALLGAAADVRRFRPNLLIDAPDGGPYPEDAWVGCVLRVGGARIHVGQRNERCAVVNVDPANGERDPGVLRAIARERDARLGVYGSTAELGRVAVGDPIVVEHAPMIAEGRWAA